MTDGADHQANQSTLRALDLLEYLCQVGSAPLGRIASDLRLNKSTLHRFLAALVGRGYVVQRDDRRYEVTLKLLTLSSLLIDRFDVREQIRPVVRETMESTGETVHVGVLEGVDVVYIDKIEGRQAVRMASRIGSRVPAHASALGKVLLAELPDGEARARLAGVELTPVTARTITDLDDLLAELDRVRRAGYAVDDLESEDGIRCVAAPVRDRSGQGVAALSISGWIISMTEERVVELGPLLRAQAARASGLLGGSEAYAALER